jgi:hypothetical protein
MVLVFIVVMISSLWQLVDVVIPFLILIFMRSSSLMWFKFKDGKIDMKKLAYKCMRQENKKSIDIKKWY